MGSPYLVGGYKAIVTIDRIWKGVPRNGSGLHCSSRVVKCGVLPILCGMMVVCIVVHHTGHIVCMRLLLLLLLDEVGVA